MHHPLNGLTWVLHTAVRVNPTLHPHDHELFILVWLVDPCFIYAAYVCSGNASFKPELAARTLRGGKGGGRTAQSRGKQGVLECVIVCATPVLIVTHDGHDATTADHQFNEAADLYTKAIDLNPKDATIWCNRAYTRIKLEEHGYGLADATTAIELDPKYAKAYYRYVLWKP